jgi:adenylate kinase family enzyme
MSDYNFSSINDKDFEELSVDLLSKKLNRSIERFKPGKDAGVDGRFFSDNGGENIIQCKHHLSGSPNSLLKTLEKDELPKLLKLNPERYYVTTSIPLSKHNKSQIKKALHPFIKRDDDIFGKEDLNGILKDYPEVEINHYKLWITSTTVLTTLLNNAIYGRSQNTASMIDKESKYFVVTKNYKEAFDKLNDKKALIITGSPGVGKTFLATELCKFYIANGYDFFEINDSITEAENVFNPIKKQIFYFDDFLGANYLQAINNRQDHQITNFIKRISHSENKRFILTSRTNILNQGKQISELFDRSKITQNEFEVSIDSLKKQDKAKILYNHIFFSDLPLNYIDEIYKNKRYHEIINHKNFNPRLISFITDHDISDETNYIDYWDFISKSLSNPEKIWAKVFENQLDEVSRKFVIAVCLNGNSISEEDLTDFYHIYSDKKLSESEKQPFKKIVKTLTGSLLNRTKSHRGSTYSLFNPSIADYIISTHYENKHYIHDILSLLKTTDSLINFSSKKTKHSDETIKKLIQSELEKKPNLDINYLLTAASKTLKLNKKILLEIINLSINSDFEETPKYFFYFLYMNSELIEDHLNSAEINKKIISKAEIFIDNESPTQYELEEIHDLLYKLEIVDENIYNKIKTKLIEISCEEITDMACDIQIFDSFSGMPDFESSLLDDKIKDIFKYFDIKIDHPILHEIKQSIDNAEVNNYFRDYFDDEYSVTKHNDTQKDNSENDIDDLFERSN